MKKYLLVLISVLIAVQLLVPAYMIWNKYDIIRTGEEYIFSVSPVDPYDAFRGRYVSFWIDAEVNQKGKYGILEVDDGGFAHIKNVTDIKPDGNAYLKDKDDGYFNVPIDRYYMDEKIAPVAESLANEFGDELAAYVTVRVKNGNCVVTGLYADGKRIEEIAESILKEENT